MSICQGLFLFGLVFLLQSPLCLLHLTTQTAWLLEFIHFSCISLEQVISRPICKYLYCVFPFQLRAGSRSEHKLHFLQHILMGWINIHDQVRCAGSQQGQISTLVMNSSRSLNHSYLHYSTVKITPFADKTANTFYKEMTFLSKLSLTYSLRIFSTKITANKKLETYRKVIKYQKQCHNSARELRDT